MKQPVFFHTFIAILLFVSAFSAEVSAQSSQTSVSKPALQKKCDASLWDHVYNAKRLRIIEDCVTVTGYVEEKKNESDGDLHMLLRLDKGFENLLNDGNLRFKNGCLVVEVICTVKIKDQDAIVPCEGYDNKIFLPKRGSHVRIIGSLVLDKHNGWNEIHPVSEIKYY